MIVGIRQIALLVRDYDEAISFYCDKLGFIIAEDTQLPAKRWVRLKSPGNMGSEILVSKAVDEDQLRIVGHQAGGRVFLYLETDDFDGDYLRLKSLGISFTEGPMEQSYGIVAVFKDLYGNRIDLIQP